MKIKIYSDLHLEFSGGTMSVPKTDEDKDTILILAGDIGNASKRGTYKEFVEDMSMQFRAVLYVMGNHEHYKGKFRQSKDKLLEAFADCPNVHVLEKDSIVFDDVAFIGATMWTNMGNMDPFVMMDARTGMNDYKFIRHGPINEPWKCKLQPYDTVEDHLNAVHYIFEEIKKQKEECNEVVVITHQAPSWQSIVPLYKGDPMNAAYVSDLEDKIIEADPKIWIHGHVHNNLDYMIENTRVICNPRGYFKCELNPDFDKFFTIDV